VLARTKVFDVGPEAVERLSIIMTYAATASIVLAALEAFTALYSGIPAAGEHLAYLFLGLDGHFGLVAWTYASWLFLLIALVVLLIPRLRRRQVFAYAATAAVLLSVLIDKGLCLVTSGFVPSPLGHVRDYRPSLIELAIAAGIYSGGALVFGAACRWLLISDAPSQSTIHALNPPPPTAREPGMATAAPMEN
jgi:molybdopterin-containing oxidoreductase family membrane subunit